MCTNVFITGAHEYFDGGRFWCKMLIKCYLCLESHGVFNLHNVVVSCCKSVVMCDLRLEGVKCVQWVLPVLHILSMCFSGESFMAVHDGISVRALSSVFTPCTSLSLTFTASLLSSVSLFPPWQPFSPSFHFTSLSLLFRCIFFYCCSKMPISHLRKQPPSPVCVCVCVHVDVRGFIRIIYGISSVGNFYFLKESSVSYLKNTWCVCLQKQNNFSPSASLWLITVTDFSLLSTVCAFVKDSGIFTRWTWKMIY